MKARNLHAPVVVAACFVIALLYVQHSKSNAQHSKSADPVKDQQQRKPTTLIGAAHAVLTLHKKLPISAKCPKTGRIAYVETNGKRIVVFNKLGQVELIVDPAKHLGLPEYRVKHAERILQHIEFRDDGRLWWAYVSSQFGNIELNSKTVHFSGQD